MRFRIISLVLAILTGALWAPVIAHQQKAAITKVLFNPRNGNIEVAHRFLLHDAEHAVREIFGGEADIISSKETQAIFARYVADRFGIAISEDKALELEMVGFEIERSFFWIYQDVTNPGDVENLSIQHGALRDLWPEQINTVNIEGLDEIKTATFQGSVEIISLDLQ
ncbi:DUF6702 family protein [Kordiimonas aquimaris]|uniref:DUF6702 family protein n=1 Tax=Kordiimonas aquimaris TaxID=707591 RepID=UPI0021CF8569|nr:DUF6702 family protein [Kordiimonas aquimaris]